MGLNDYSATGLAARLAELERENDELRAEVERLRKARADVAREIVAALETIKNATQTDSAHVRGRRSGLADAIVVARRVGGLDG